MTPGTRFAGAPGAVYELTGPGWETDRHAYLLARKRFRNFRYPADSLDEAPDDESLAVVIRRPLPGNDPDAARMTFERETVLTSPGLPWFLDVIDWIEPLGSGHSVPWLVAAQPLAAPLNRADPAARVVFACEAMAMLDALHASGLAVGPMSAVDFLCDGPGRWYFLGTDRVRPLESTGHARDDLSAWAGLTDDLIRGESGAWPREETFVSGLREQFRWLRARVREGIGGNP